MFCVVCEENYKHGDENVVRWVISAIENNNVR